MTASRATARLLMFLLPSLIGDKSFAQSTAPEAPAEAQEERSAGLPSAITWTFNFDAGWGTFGFANSYFTNPKGSQRENLSDQWFEGYVKPALSAEYAFGSSSEIYGKLSVVGERTYGSAPELYGPDVSSFGPEDALIGWRSGASIGTGENLLDFSVGRLGYRIGSGMLLWDGAAEGGSRGGYWTNARKAFAFGAVARVKPGIHTFDAFYLDRDELPEDDTGTRLFGVNYEAAVSESTRIGATYMKFTANRDMKPGRDGLNVFNVRADGSPVHTVPDLSFAFEYASERNGDALDSNAWTLQCAYELSSVTWKPKLSYRYAYFQGDDPNTPANEAFDPLLPGFSDWGSWWQGEIAGEYFFSNSNLISQQIRAHVAPSERLGGGLILYDFRLDQPTSVAASVTEKQAAFEGDVYIDWKLNKNFLVSVVTAFANPGAAVKQASGRTKNFSYGMVYLGYSF